MCCPLDQQNGKLQVREFVLDDDDDDEIYHLKGIYDHSLKTLADRISRYFQRLELLEKVVEIADELFHLCDSVFQQYANLTVYQTLRNLHHGAHDIEHVLHPFCFFGDLNRLYAGNFLEYHDHESNQLDYLRSMSRIFLATAHFFSTASFLHELKLCPLDRFGKVFKYTSIFSAVGYALWTISLIWRRLEGKANDQFASDMSIHLGGCLFESISLIKTTHSFLLYTSILSKVAAIAGIIHAWFVVQRLMPKESEEVDIRFCISSNGRILTFDPEEEHFSHHH